ncbi:MAG: dolichyl-phosphate-mannose--protein mannosyltransferase [Candidatus Velamenicoccus archaeovorus]
MSGAPPSVADTTSTRPGPAGVLETIRRLLNRPAVAIVAVGLIAGVLRFAHLSYPTDRVFDELYYSKSACIYLGYSNARCDIESSDEEFWRTDKNDTGAWVHPPLGKWAIALGELAFGTGSFGWRVSAAVFGTATVVVLAGMVQLLFGSPIWTFTGGLLLATESLEFVQSRVSMLDIFVTFWIALGFLFVLLDRRWIDRRTPAAEPPTAVEPGDPGAMLDPDAAPEPEPTATVPAPFFRPWRLAAGLALGAAVASKWSGVTGIAGVIGLSVLWEIVRRRRAGVRHPIWRTVQWESFPIVVFLLAVPVVVYVASYLGWFLHFGFHWGDWLKLQGDMAGYHEKLRSIDAQGKPIHPYLAQAWKWIVLWRPVLYFARYGDDVRRVIYANGNPAIFWGSVVAIPYAAFAWRRTRDWRAGFVVLSVAALYVPWFLVSRPQFFFYAAPLTPFLVLACVYGLRDLSEAHIAGSRSRPWLPVAVGLVIVSVALFVWFWPVLTGGPISSDAFRLRAWFPTWI